MYVENYNNITTSSRTSLIKTFKESGILQTNHLNEFSITHITEKNSCK